MAQTYKHEEIEHNDNDDNDDDDDIFFLLNGIQKDADSRHTPQYTSNSRSFPEANRDGGSSKISSTFDDSEIEMFVDVNGLPTDTFLESLKQDALAASEALDRKLVSEQESTRGSRDFTSRKQDINVNYQSRYLDSSSESDSEDFDDATATPHRRHNSFFQHLQKEKKKCASGSETALSHEVKKTNSVTARKSLKKAASVHRNSEASREAPGHATPIPVSSLKRTKSEPRSSGASNYLSGSLDTGRNVSRKGLRGRGKVARVVTTTKREEGGKRGGSSMRVSQSVERDAIAASLTKQMEHKNDSLKLRLQGQLNSIRVLETQLAEAQHSIAVRDLELAAALRRVTQLESREKDKLLRKEPEEDVGGGWRRSGQKDDSKMYQLKTELIAVQARFNDEKARRCRTEERLRLIKEHCDKQKIRVAEAEAKTAELEGVLQALHGKLQKKKQEMKASSKDINMNRMKVVEKDHDLQSCKNQLLRSERCTKDQRQDNDRLKEELRLLRREVSVSEDKNRRNTLEIEVLRERQSATKLAYRLQNQSQNLHQNSNHHLASSTKNPPIRGRASTSSFSYSNSNSSNGSCSGHAASMKNQSLKSSPERKNAYASDSDNDTGFDDQSLGTKSLDSSSSSYDIDPLLARDDGESAHIDKRTPTHIPLPPPPRNEDISSSGVNKSQGGGGVGDVSLLSDSSGLGEQFERLQKMYSRVQGGGSKKH